MNLEFLDSVDLRELHVVVKERFGDDVEDALPLQWRGSGGADKSGHARPFKTLRW